MLEAGSRQRNQPAPPHVIFEVLTDLDRNAARPWLLLLDDEQSPQLIDARAPDFVVWSSLWQKRPDASVRFDLAPDGAAGTALRWTLFLDEPLPDPSLLGHLRKRLNELINELAAHLRAVAGLPTTDVRPLPRCRGQVCNLTGRTTGVVMTLPVAGASIGGFNA